MRLKDLTKDISTMTDEELTAHIKEIRNNKYVAKPAVVKRTVTEPAKQEHNTAVRKVNKLVDGMTAEQQLQLLKLLEEGGQNG